MVGLVRGVDASNNNGVVDWAKVRRRARFAWLKVSEGVNFVDGFYDRNDRAARTVELVVGGYHFGHPGRNPVEQADLFLSDLRLHRGDLLPVLDLEQTDGLDSIRVQRWAAQFLSHVEKEIGAKPVIYSGASFLHTNLPALSREYPLWVADWGAKPSGPWVAWQYTAKGPLGLDESVAPSLTLLRYKQPVARRAIARGVSPLGRRFGRL